MKKRRKYSRKDPMRNISRVDYLRPEGSGGDTHGYYVRFQVHGKRVFECFNDTDHGGDAGTLAAAKAFRDGYEASFQPHIGKRAHFQLGPRNTSGILGVRKRPSTFTKSSGKSFTYEFWEATWPTVDGKTAKKSFSCHRLGDDAAKAAAVAVRRDGIAKLDNALRSRERLVFDQPSDDTTIWRYMDFAKFSYLVAHGSLYMPLIRELDDPFEGSFSKANAAVRSRLGKLGAIAGLDPEVVRSLRKWIAVSCWHMSEHESAAMWKLYASVNGAICVKSSVGRLRAAMPPHARVAAMKYVDYEKDWVPEVSPFQPFLCKRKSFEHEREIRALVLHAESPAFEMLDLKASPPSGGFAPLVDLAQLIEAVHIAPESPAWFLSLVRKIMADRDLGVIPVHQSSLEATPVY